MPTVQDTQRLMDDAEGAVLGIITHGVEAAAKRADDEIKSVVPVAYGATDSPVAAKNAQAHKTYIVLGIVGLVAVAAIFGTL